MASWSFSCHAWSVEHHHGAIGDPEVRPYGNGVSLWFEVDDFDAAVKRVGELDPEIVLAPHRNPPEGQPGGPAHREVWLRDPDGYTVVLASPDGEAAWLGPGERGPISFFAGAGHIGCNHNSQEDSG